MKSFEESLKSKKTVASMIENKKDTKPVFKGKEKGMLILLSNELLPGAGCF